MYRGLGIGSIDQRKMGAWLVSCLGQLRKDTKEDFDVWRTALSSSRGGKWGSREAALLRISWGAERWLEPSYDFGWGSAEKVSIWAKPAPAGANVARALLFPQRSEAA